MERPATVGAFCLDGEREKFSSQLPLHEGHRNRVDASSGVDLLTSTEGHPVWGRRYCHRISPNDGTLSIPEKESHVRFQLTQDSNHTVEREAQAVGDELWGNRSSLAGQLSNHEVSDLMVISCHEF